MNTTTHKITRSSFLKQLGLLSGLALAGCTPVRILLKNYPRRYDNDANLREATLRAFVIAVIPGADPEDPNLARMFSDEYYPFHSYCGFFVGDLNSRSGSAFGVDEFASLPPPQRTEIIQQGLDADAATARLYKGAILMAQASYYGGIYDDNAGCRLIDFDGTNGGFSREEMCYPNTPSLLARQITQTGNLN